MYKRYKRSFVLLSRSSVFSYPWCGYLSRLAFFRTRVDLFQDWRRAHRWWLWDRWLVSVSAFWTSVTAGGIINPQGTVLNRGLYLAYFFFAFLRVLSALLHVQQKFSCSSWPLCCLYPWNEFQNPPVCACLAGSFLPLYNLALACSEIYIPSCWFEWQFDCLSLNHQIGFETKKNLQGKCRLGRMLDFIWCGFFVDSNVLFPTKCKMSWFQVISSSFCGWKHSKWHSCNCGFFLLGFSPFHASRSEYFAVFS